MPEKLPLNAVRILPHFSSLDQHKLGDFSRYQHEMGDLIKAQAPIDQEHLVSLKDSIAAHAEIGQGHDGLLEPIEVLPRGEEYWVIHGRYRLLACQLLGRKEIACELYNLPHREDDPEGWYRALLSVIDKQVVERSLTFLERGELLVKRTSLLRKLGLAAPVHVNQFMDFSPDVQRTLDLAKQANMSLRSFQLASQIATSLMPEVKTAVRDLDLSVRDLLRIARAGADGNGRKALSSRERRELTRRQLEVLQEVVAAKELKQEPPKIEPESSSIARLANRRSPEVAVPAQAKAVATGGRVVSLASKRRKVVEPNSWVQLQGRHSIYCGATNGGDFADYAPDAELAIAPLLVLDEDKPVWEHDWLANKARVVVAIARMPMIMPFADVKRMPYRGATQAWMHTNNRSKPDECLAIFLFSHSMEINSQVLKPLRATSWEDLYLQLITPFTRNGDHVIIPQLSKEALRVAERIGRRCYFGHPSVEECGNFIDEWCQESGASARRTNLRSAAVVVG